MLLLTLNLQSSGPVVPPMPSYASPRKAALVEEKADLPVVDPRKAEQVQ